VVKVNIAWVDLAVQGVLGLLGYILKKVLIIIWSVDLVHIIYLSLRYRRLIAKLSATLHFFWRTDCIMDSINARSRQRLDHSFTSAHHRCSAELRRELGYSGWCVKVEHTEAGISSITAAATSLYNVPVQSIMNPVVELQDINLRR
jgi:hypothetical protein